MSRTRCGAGALRFVFALAALSLSGPLTQRTEAAEAPSKARLMAIRIQSLPNATRVVLELRGQVRSSSARLQPASAPQGRPRVYVDLRGAELDPTVARAVPVGDAFLAAELAAQVGRRTSAKVISVDYRLAPEDSSNPE